MTNQRFQIWPIRGREIKKDYPISNMTLFRGSRDLDMKHDTSLRLWLILMNPLNWSESYFTYSQWLTFLDSDWPEIFDSDWSKNLDINCSKILYSDMPEKLNVDWSVIISSDWLKGLDSDWQEILVHDWLRKFDR